MRRLWFENYQPPVRVGLVAKVIEKVKFNRGPRQAEKTDRIFPSGAGSNGPKNFGYRPRNSRLRYGGLWAVACSRRARHGATKQFLVWARLMDKVFP
jgi:hypothetical protein